MEVNILNDISIKKLYNYPESGFIQEKLTFLVYSIEKVQNNQLKLELCDLKYKIGNVFVNDEKSLKIGDYITSKYFSYIYKEDVIIKINDFQILGNKYFDLLENINEYENEKYINCYFLYKENDFIGFNNEVLITFNPKNDSKIKFEDSKLYLFKRLEKINNKNVKYNKIISFISENSGIIIYDNISNLKSNIPYCFEGKILEINKNKILLVSPNIDNIFISIKIKEKINNISERDFIKLSSMRYDSTKGNILFFTLTKFTKIEKIDPQESEDHRIYIKFNFFGNLLKIIYQQS